MNDVAPVGNPAPTFNFVYTWIGNQIINGPPALVPNGYIKYTIGDTGDTMTLPSYAAIFHVWLAGKNDSGGNIYFVFLSVKNESTGDLYYGTQWSIDIVNLMTGEYDTNARTVNPATNWVDQAAVPVGGPTPITPQP